MCDKSVVLGLFFVLKVVALLVIPVIIIFFNRKFNFKKIDILFYIDLALILLLIVLRITNNSCVVNSTVNGIKININKNSSEYIEENNHPSEVEQIVTNKIYKSTIGNNVYYFNNNELPLSNKKIVCDDKEVYMKNYGNSITATSIAVSSVLNRNIDPIEILKNVISDNYMDCDNGVGINEVLASSASRYAIRYYDISNAYVSNELLSGSIIIAEVKNVPGASNVTCSTSYIVLYNIDNNGSVHILNPNDLKTDYICPLGTPGYLDIIEAYSNSKNWNLSDILNISSRFIKIEVQ